MPHQIILDGGDGITESDIRTLLGRESMSGYVAQGGLDVSLYADDTVDVSDGTVYILDNLQDITVKCDSFVGHSLVADAVNHLWIAVDPAAATDDEAVSLVSNATGVSPANPAIKIAEVDTNQSGDAAVTPVNRGTAPALDGEAINPKSVGGETPTQSVSTHNLSRNGSYREGTLVHYDARDRGPYVDGQDALDDTPEGGTFRLAATEYDVATEGRVVANKPLIVEGEGWGQFAGSTRRTGTIINNRGSDATDSPAVLIQTPDGSERMGQVIVRNLSVNHEGGSYAISLIDTNRAAVENININGFQSGFGGIRFAGESWASRLQMVNISQMTGVGISVDTTGSHVELYTPYVYSSIDGAVGIDIRDNYTPVFGGECRLVGNNAVGVQYINDGGELTGGACYYHLIEGCDTGFRMDGAAKVSQVDIWHPHGPLDPQNSGATTLVDFGNARDCRCWYPQVRAPGGGGDVVSFGAESVKCGYIHSSVDTRSAPIAVDPSAFECYQSVPVPKGTVAEVNTDPNLLTKVGYSLAQNAPVWHDGSGWHKASATGFTP